MQIELDLHTHTVASGHAYSTLQEMVRAAADKGIRLLGITEHTPGIPGTCDLIYLRNLHVVPRTMYGVRLLLGAEINVLDTRGTLDLTEEYMQRLDLRIAGIHSLCYIPGTCDENTQGLVQAMAHPYIDLISHPGDGTAAMHMEVLVEASLRYGTLLEINNSSLKPIRHKEEARDNNLQLLRLCKQYGQPVLLGSDAHISFDVAEYGYLYPLLAETEFPEELILNRSVEAFETYLADMRRRKGVAL